MSPVRMSKVEAAMRAALEFKEAFNHHDVEEMARLVSEDCVFESNVPAPDGGVYKGKEEFAKYWQGFFGELPGVQMEIEDASGLGDRCVMRWRYEWGGEGEDKGHIRGVDVIEVKDGEIVEIRSYVKGRAGYR